MGCFSRNREKGVVLILFACLLPFFFLCAGFAIDLGWIFMRKSQLQNAADAAALAGAAAFGASKSDSIGSHPDADAVAGTYLSTNGAVKASFNLAAPKRVYGAQTAGDGRSYYRVYVEEDIKTFFVQMVGLGPTAKVAVDAVAAIPSKGGSSFSGFDELINFSGTLSGTFNNNNGSGPYTNRWYNQWTGQWEESVYGNNNAIQSTYDNQTDRDKVVVTSNKSFYDQNVDDLYFRFFTDSARNQPRFDATDKGLYTKMQYEDEKTASQKQAARDSYITNLFSNNSSVISLSGNQNVSIPSSGNGKSSDYYQVSGETNIQNLTINLSNVSGDTKSPIYVYVTGKYDLINVNVQEDITRPIIFSYLGESGPWSSSRTQIHYNGNNHNFRGVIYIPYADNIPFNYENGTFQGSIYSHDLQLQSNHGRFIYESFNLAGGGSGSGSGGTSGPSAKLRLVDSRQLGLTWQ